MRPIDILVDKKLADAVINEALAQYPQLTGASVGIIKKNGVESVGLRFKVERKVSLESLEPHQVLPKQFRGFKVDVVQGFAKIQVEAERKTGSNPRVLSDVLQPGHSIGDNKRTGTLGGVLMNKRTGRVYGLTNNHVLPREGDKVFHPGYADMEKGREVGRTIKTTNSGIDAALFGLEGTFRNTPVGQETPLKAHKEAKLLDVVMKMGRTTMLTYGKVVGFGKVRLGYDNGMQNISSIEIRPLQDGNPNNEEISEGGDSGSFWTLKDGTVIGLHFAGEGSPDKADEIAYACPIGRVIEYFNSALNADLVVYEPQIASIPQSSEIDKSAIITRIHGIIAQSNQILEILK